MKVLCVIRKKTKLVKRLNSFFLNIIRDPLKCYFFFIYYFYDSTHVVTVSRRCCVELYYDILLEVLFDWKYFVWFFSHVLKYEKWIKYSVILSLQNKNWVNILPCWATWPSALDKILYNWIITSFFLNFQYLQYLNYWTYAMKLFRPSPLIGPLLNIVVLL